VRRYRYVGSPDHLRDLSSARTAIRAASDARAFAGETVTFVVTDDGQLWVADRRSEHVACARGGDVLAAGELTFAADGTVEGATNQSTGFCPEPTSIDALRAALDRAGIAAPRSYEPAFEFRRCATCGVNLIKEGVFECAVCGEPLPAEWNF
jgi:hypothetical protein